MASFGISFCAQHLSEVGGDSEALGQLEIGINKFMLIRLCSLAVSKLVHCLAMRQSIRRAQSAASHIVLLC